MIAPMHPPPPGITTELHLAIYEVIARRHVAEVEEQGGRTRVGEPHDYGIMNGKPVLLFYQTSGYSSSGGLPEWRHLPVGKITSVRPLDKTFRGGRAIQGGRHRAWDLLFIRADPS